ncbi:ATP synthase subunit d, mitochondrial-like [Trichoplusia ni]|uniref:ATP synthase subunit d, mitochondrial n=1 Tax=Trichoplusia ni TaxID=7111 RepID=A0A7E5W2V0_TRINI|nr:ATP synthase subunit d, mitochondrial-like [Trichoplusia ni]
MAKRFVKSSINWKELEKRVPPEQRGKFFAFKGRAELYFRRMMSNPPQSPKIDWEGYKKIVPVPGLVEKFQKEYEALKIPYPEDKYSSEVSKEWLALQPEIKKYTDEMQAHMDKANAEVKRIEALPKFEDMTLEVFYDVYPEQAMDFVKKPSFWPHTPDEQLGYVDPTQKIEK